MKERLIAFFNNPHNGKVRRSSLILTIVALVEILALMIVSTSAWVESVSSIKIFTTAQTETNGTKGVVESPIKQHANLNSSNNGTIDLSDYFRPSGAFHFAGASSTDGKTMYFPEIKGGDDSRFRIGSINDKNVNYISFTVKTNNIGATNNRYSLAFDSVPTFSFGGTELDPEDEESKLVRFSIVDNNGDVRVYSLYNEMFTEEVPADELVVPESEIDDPDDPDYHQGFATTTVYPFYNYVKGRDRAVEAVNGGYLSFNMWIQDPDGSNSSVYQNKALTVSNFKLVIVTPFTVKASYKNGTSYTVDTTGISGTVAIENSAYGKEAVYYAVPGQDINLHAIASESNGYQFMGWYTSVTNTSVFNNSDVDPYTYTIPSNGSVTTLYAKFSNEHDIYMYPEYQHDSTVRYATYVFGINAQGVNEGTWYDMTSSSFNGNQNYYKCTYKGSATSIIFCYMKPNTTNDWQNRWLQTFDLTVPSRMGSYAYIVTSRAVVGTNRNQVISDYGTNKLYGYWVHSHVRVEVAYATGSSGGGHIFAGINDSARTNNYYSTDTNTKYAWWYNDDYTNKYLNMDGKAYQDVDGDNNLIANQKYDKRVTLTAEDSSSKKFVGWYTNAAGTTAVANSIVDGTTYTSTSRNYCFVATDNPSYSGTDVETTQKFYAKYADNPTKTINIYVAPRENWTDYYLKVMDSENSTLSNNLKCNYDGTTGYYKATVTTTKNNVEIKASLDGGSNYFTVISDTGTTTQTFNKRVATDNTVSNRSTYRCIWFIIGSGQSGIKSDITNYGDYMNIWANNKDNKMRRINDNAYVFEFSSISGTIYFQQHYSGTGYRNQWSATISSSKSQYTTSTYSSGSWTN